MNSTKTHFSSIKNSAKVVRTHWHRHKQNPIARTTYIHKQAGAWHVAGFDHSRPRADARAVAFAGRVDLTSVPTGQERGAVITRGGTMCANNVFNIYPNKKTIPGNVPPDLRGTKTIAAEMAFRCWGLTTHFSHKFR